MKEVQKNSQQDSYLLKKLEEGENLNIVYMSHNAYWSPLEKLEENYENYHVQIYGSSTSYIKQSKNRIKDCDLIIFYSSRALEKEELMEMKNIAFDMSMEKNKRVSIGYSYTVPETERKAKDIKTMVELVSFANGEEISEKSYGIKYFTPLDLVEMTFVLHDELEKQTKHRNNMRKMLKEDWNEDDNQTFDNIKETPTKTLKLDINRAKNLTAHIRKDFVGDE